MRHVSIAGVVGRACQIPGTGFVGRSIAEATRTTRPRTKFGNCSGSVSLVLNPIAVTCGAVVSVSGPMWPAASGFAMRPW
jgi:hypothetical protein